MSKVTHGYIFLHRWSRICVRHFEYLLKFFVPILVLAFLYFGAFAKKLFFLLFLLLLLFLGMCYKLLLGQDEIHSNAKDYLHYQSALANRKHYPQIRLRILFTANVKSHERRYPLPPEASPLPQTRYCTYFFRSLSSSNDSKKLQMKKGQEGHEVLCYFALHTWRKFLPMVRQPHYRTCTLMLSGHQIKLHRPRSVVLDPFGPLVVKPAHGLQSVCVVS